jgi:hypothetical protein
VEVRILASAINASVTFDLRCEIREQLLSFLQARPRLFGDFEPFGRVRPPTGCRNRRQPNQQPVFSGRALGLKPDESVKYQ